MSKKWKSLSIAALGAMVAVSMASVGSASLGTSVTPGTIPIGSGEGRTVELVLPPLAPQYIDADGATSFCLGEDEEGNPTDCHEQNGVQNIKFVGSTYDSVTQLTFNAFHGVAKVTGGTCASTKAVNYRVVAEFTRSGGGGEMAIHYEEVDPAGDTSEEVIGPLKSEPSEGVSQSRVFNICGPA